MNPRRSTLSGRDLETIRDRLQELADQAEALLQLINGRMLFGGERELARERYRAFKDRLRAEYHRGASVRGEQSLTEAERHFYHHAIHGAYCQLRSSTNCVPGPELFGEIYSARIDITHALQSIDDLI